MVNKIMVTDMGWTLYSANNTHFKVLLECLENLIICYISRGKKNTHTQKPNTFQKADTELPSLWP